MEKLQQMIGDVVYEFIDDVNFLYQIKRDCQINGDGDDIFYCYNLLKNSIKMLSMLDGGFVCSKKEFCSFDIVEYHNIETTVVFLKNISIMEYCKVIKWNF